MSQGHRGVVRAQGCFKGTGVSQGHRGVVRAQGCCKGTGVS